MNLETDRRENAEVYEGLVNYAAFVDKIVVDVKGTRRAKPKMQLVTGKSRAIGGPDSFYARCVDGRTLGGNPFQLGYGPMRPYKHVAPFKSTFRAGRRPLLCSDTLLCLDNLFRRGYKASVSRVELTFDVEIPYNDLARS